MNNPGIYDAVIAGSGGTLQGNGSTQSALASFADKADVLAVAVDSLIPTIAGGASASQIALMSEVVSGLVFNRFLGTFDNGSHPDYTGMAIEIAKLYNELATSLNNAPLPGSGGSFAPLHDVLFVDLNTQVQSADQDGSIAKPFSAIATAIAQNPDSSQTLLICPGDYRAEGMIIIPTGTAKSLVSFDYRMPALYVLNPVSLGPQVQIQGIGYSGPDAQCQLSLVGIQIQSLNAGEETPGMVQLSNSYVYLCAVDNMSVYADRSFFDNGGISCLYFNATSCGFLGSQSIVCTIDDGHVWLNHCVAGTTAVVFPLGRGGIVHVDPWSYNTVSGLTNGAMEVEGLPLQYIDGATTAELVDSIILAGENLRFWIDQRV